MMNQWEQECAAKTAANEKLAKEVQKHLGGVVAKVDHYSIRITFNNVAGEYWGNYGITILTDPAHMCNVPRGMYGIVANWPVVDHREFSPGSTERLDINVSMSKSPEKIVKDIQQRIIGKGYEALYRQQVQRALEERDRKNRKANAIKELAELMDCRIPVHTDTLSSGRLNVHELRVDEMGTGAVLKTYNIPLEAVRKVLEVLKAYPG